MGLVAKHQIFPLLPPLTSHQLLINPTIHYSTFITFVSPFCHPLFSPFNAFNNTQLSSSITCKLSTVQQEIHNNFHNTFITLLTFTTLKHTTPLSPKSHTDTILNLNLSHTTPSLPNSFVYLSCPKYSLANLYHLRLDLPPTSSCHPSS